MSLGTLKMLRPARVPRMSFSRLAGTVATACRDVLDGKVAVQDASASRHDVCGLAPLSNGFYHGEAGYRRVTTASRA